MSVRSLVLVAGYLAAQMLGDLGSLKIIAVAGLSMDAGTLVYPLTFTLRDLVHKSLGLKAARALIITAAAINAVMAVFFWIVASLPGDPQVGPQTEFSVVLSPVWRIVAASIIAEVISELIDTEAYRGWIAWFGEKRQWMRVVFSNGISTPIDSMLFAWLAFGGLWDGAVVWGIVLSNVALKYVVTVASVPLIYAVKERPQEQTEDQH